MLHYSMATGLSWAHRGQAKAGKKSDLKKSLNLAENWLGAHVWTDDYF